MAYTAENFTRDEIEYLIEKLLDTDLNNQDTASLILDFVEFYCKKRMAIAKKLLNHFLDFESAAQENGHKINDSIRQQAEAFLSSSENPNK